MMRRRLFLNEMQKVTDSWLFGKRGKIFAAPCYAVHQAVLRALDCSGFATDGRAQPWSHSPPSPVSQAARSWFMSGGNATSKLFERRLKVQRTVRD
jgi:hypothetical protein